MSHSLAPTPIPVPPEPPPDAAEHRLLATLDALGQDEDPSPPLTSRHPRCPGCGRPRPADRLIFCAPACAAADRSVMSVFFTAADLIEQPILRGSPGRIAGVLPGDQLYLRHVPASFLQVQVVRRVDLPDPPPEAHPHRKRETWEAGEVRGGQVGPRQSLQPGDLDGWTCYGQIDASGAFVASSGRRAD